MHHWRLILLALLLSGAAARAETIELKDGTKITGTVVEESDTVVTVKVKFGTIQYPKNEIKSRSGGDAAPEPAKPAAVPVKPDDVKIDPVPPAPVPRNPVPDQPPDPDKRDVIVLKDGTEQRGFIVSEGDADVVFDIVMSGRKVSKTLLSRTTFNKAEIDSIKKLSEAERAAAIKDLNNAAKETKVDAAAEQNIRIDPISWPSKDPNKKIPAKKVELEHFTIESDVDDELLRKLAFRLDKVFTAYTQHFGCDRNQAVKVRVVVFNSMEEYYAAIGNAMKNPAFYAPDLKLISAGCDVAKYEQQIADVREHHRVLDIRLREWKIDLSQARADVREQVSRAYDQINAGGRGATPEGQAAMEQVKQQERQWQLAVGEKEKMINQIQDEIFALNRRNDVVFTEVMQQTLATMYHEGFHAFLDNFLFTPEQVKLVPRWLNEGLAQYFEAARLENGHFILGQDVREKLVLLEKFRNENALFTLEQLVNGGPSDYLVHEISNLQRSTKNYLQAWLLTAVLGDKGRLTREILQGYVAELASHHTGIEALKALSGMPNAELEKLMDQKLAPSVQAPEEKK